MSLTKADFVSRVRVGFELETHESEGETFYGSNLSSALDAASLKVERAASNGNWIDYMEAPKAVADWIKANQVSIDYRMIEIITNGMSDKIAAEALGSNFDFGGLIDVGEDGSVDGFEFRTKGPNTVPQALKAIGKLFQLEHAVDTDCSFHIHVSVDGTKHVYGKNMQARLINAVLKRLPALPDSVIKRFESESIDRWARLALANEKYTFVAYRGATWEFRCFGNVSTKAEAEACLQVALDSMYEALTGRGLAGTKFSADKAKERITAEYDKRFKKVNKAA